MHPRRTSGLLHAGFSGWNECSEGRGCVSLVQRRCEQMALERPTEGEVAKGSAISGELLATLRSGCPRGATRGLAPFHQKKHPERTGVVPSGCGGGAKRAGNRRHGRPSPARLAVVPGGVHYMLSAGSSFRVKVRRTGFRGASTVLPSASTSVSSITLSPIGSPVMA